MPKLWYMNLYPGGRADRIGDTSFDLCLRENVVGIGWSRLNPLIKTNSGVSYDKAAESVFGKAYPAGKSELKKWRKQIEYLTKMKKGDLVWTKRSRGHFFLNRITDDIVQPLNGIDFEHSDFGAGRRCDWNEVMDYLDVPGEVKRNTRGTIHPVKDENGVALALSEDLYNLRIGGAVYHVPKLQKGLLDLLGPEEMEDLVGIYLQVEKGLLVIPSTSKQSTSPVEFWMIDRRTGDRIGVQVKTGTEEIDLEGYKNEPNTIYFFQKKPRIARVRGRIFIDEEELLSFVRKNPKVLPGSISNLRKRIGVTGSSRSSFPGH